MSSFKASLSEQIEILKVSERLAREGRWKLEAARKNLYEGKGSSQELREAKDNIHEAGLLLFRIDQ